MEKLTSIWGIIMLCLFLSTNLTGQTTEEPDPPALVVMDEDDGKNGDGITLNQDDQTVIAFFVYVTNIHPLEFCNPGVPYSLPIEYPAMGLEYSVGGNQGVAFVDPFYFIGDVGGIPVFKARVEITMSFSHECDSSNPGGDENYPIYVSGDYRLVAGDQGEFYPIADYSNGDDLFSCDVFDQTCGYCYRGCPIIGEVNFSINHEFICMGAENNGPEAGQTDVPSGFSTSGRLSSGVLTFPNPSQHSVQVKYSAEESSNGQLQLFDHMGRIVFFQSINSVKGINIESLDISQLQQGIYWGQLHQDNKVQVFKVIKIE